eukprot:TRINITY_DN33046_c0_g1_i1.p1 TRINITY_DN33046_c0_g1~~TRINITY_DN33046_c0_g1_i1.p1  ORF type:complete len:339 (+),score=19.64 TRINITY_DN33046_c0_g1_i1:30-1019(+)
MWVQLILAFVVSPVCGYHNELAYVRGANYLPSYSHNDVQTWIDFDAGLVDRELGWARSKLDLNTVRIFLHSLPWKYDRVKFTANLTSLLQSCEKHKLKALFVIFDDDFGNITPNRTFITSGEYKHSNWVPNPGPSITSNSSLWAPLEAYVDDLLAITKKMPSSVLAFGLMNEPHRGGLHPFLSHFGNYISKRLKQHRLPQFLTCDQYFSYCTNPQATNQTALSLHSYDPPPTLEKQIKAILAQGATSKLPAMVTECANRKTDFFEVIMPVFYKYPIGWIFWELMLGVDQFDKKGNNGLVYQGVLYPNGTFYRPEEQDCIRYGKCGPPPK